MTGIYKIESKIKPDRIYIGSAVSFRKRHLVHLHLLRNNKHINKKLQNHYNKYGESDFTFTIIITCKKEDLLSREQELINCYDPYFNICKITGSVLGLKMTKESKRKISKAHTGNSISEETKQKIRKSQLGKLSSRYGIKHIEETLQKMRKPREKHWHHTEETKEKIRRANLGDLNPMRKKAKLKKD